MSDQLIVSRGLSKRFGARYALNNVNLEVARGRISGLLGPNGAGKTTLIKLLCRALQPTEGLILMDNQQLGVHTKLYVSHLPDRQ